MVDDYVKTILVIMQRDQAYALGYISKEWLKYYGCRARIYSNTNHIKICEQPTRLLKPCREACLKKAMKNP